MRLSWVIQYVLHYPASEVQTVHALIRPTKRIRAACCRTVLLVPQTLTNQPYKGPRFNKTASTSPRESLSDRVDAPNRIRIDHHEGTISLFQILRYGYGACLGERCLLELSIELLMSERRLDHSARLSPVRASKFSRQRSISFMALVTLACESLQYTVPGLHTNLSAPWEPVGTPFL